MPQPWHAVSRASINFITAGAAASRTDPPERRRALAEADLAALRAASSLPAIEVWTDGAAVGGVRDGGAGAVIHWHDGGDDTVLNKAAGVVCSSTTAEAEAAALGICYVARRLLHPAYPRVALRLLFDSRALHERLQRPVWRAEEYASHTLQVRLGALAERHDVSVVWVPGHANLIRNERADAAATAARRHDQRGVALTEDGAVGAVHRFLEQRELAAYRAALPADHIHREASTDGRVPVFHHLPRDKATTLHQLRLNRWPALQATQHRHGLADSPACRRCTSGDPDDTRHLLLHCRALDHHRQCTLGPGASLAQLHNDPEQVLRFLEAVGLP
jgi:ribonuclease HI